MALPGFVLGDSRRGWFRVCVSAYTSDETVAAVERMLKH